MRQSPKNIFSLVTTALLMLTLMTACTNSVDDLNKYIADVQERPADPIPPIPPVRTYTPYEYDGTVGRDPFRASVNEGSDDERSSNRNGPRPDFERSREFLERYELDTMAMVGTLKKDGFNWVLIQDPEGEVHPVLVGNYLGRNHGQVGQISDTKITLSELISDGAGGWLVREASIALGEG